MCCRHRFCLHKFEATSIVSWFHKMLVCQPDLESLIWKASFSTCDSGSCQLAEAPWNIFSNYNTKEKGKGCVYWFVMSTCMHVKLHQSCLTLCDPVDYSPPGSSVYGILQARIPKWVVMSSFRGSSWSKDPKSVPHSIGRRVLYP